MNAQALIEIARTLVSDDKGLLAMSQTLIDALATLAPRHLVMCVLVEDASLAAAAAQPTRTAGDAYRSALAMRALASRARGIAVLRERGAIVVDVPAPELTVAAMDAYLAVKARARCDAGRACASRECEIGEQQRRAERSDRQPQRNRRAQRGEEPLDRAGDDEHQCDAGHQHPGSPAVDDERVDAAQRAPVRRARRPAGNRLRPRSRSR